MKKRFNIDKTPMLRGNERIPFEKINAKLITLGWDSSIEFDLDYGWYILSCKSHDILGVMLRRIKPYKVISQQDLFSSIKLQEKLRHELVQVIPYKVYKGTRIFFPNINDEIDFMSEAKFQLFRKFFRTSDFSLEGVDKIEAKKNNIV